MHETTLGLDLGPNSIGWALIAEQEERILAAGVRVFPEGVDNFDTKKEKPKNESRRIARGMRRQIARRARRKRKLREALVNAGLLPSDPEAQAALDSLDPYLLRRRALDDDEKLSLHEFGRVLVHLCQRRGFLSNRKSDRERKKETKGMLAEINELAASVEASGSRTLGEHLAAMRDDPHCRIRNRHTRRDMYEHEFDAVWSAQQKHYPDVLSGDLKKRIHCIIFFQRKMYWPKSVVGLCELEPKQRRCPRADRLAQRFRLLQEVNNLKYIDVDTGQERRLSGDHRTLLLDKLSKRKEMTFDQIRKALGFLESIHFNLEKGKRTKLQGMVTDSLLANKKVFGPAWHDRPEDEKNRIVRALIHQEDREVYELATGAWGLDPQAAENLMDVDLPAGYLHLSQTALEKLLPHMERGLLYMTDDDTPSALSEAGYLRPDQIQRRIYDALPNPPDLTNPIVRQAMFELRKVLNAIIRRYGKPAHIHIELARDAKANSKQREEISKQMRDRQAQRDRAADRVRDHGVKVTRDAIDRYLLWEEQGKVCLYTGKSISIAQLLGGEVAIDHILPRSRCLDDSMPNKVLGFRAANAEKGNRTPYEWLAESDPDRFEQVRQRAARLPYNKRKRFTQKTLNLDDFISRQLNDTRYISRAVLEYVRCLVENPHDVLCTKGQQTATLRRHWDLNRVLRHDDRDMKNRDDHRHHAVDAIVVALTSRSRLQQLAALHRRGGTDATGELMIDPWDHFRDDVEEVVNRINVSHRVRRKVSGALHEDTIYGPTDAEGEFVVRKPLESLTPAMIDDIRDQRVRELVIERLNEHGVKHGRGAKSSIPAEVWKKPLLLTRKPGRHTSKPTVIRKVRLIKRDLTIEPIRHGSVCVKPGNTHHIVIFDVPEAGGRTRREMIAVNMLQAVERQRAGLPLISRTHPDNPDATFVVSLSHNEMVLLEHNGKEDLYRFDTAAATSHQMWFRHHTAAGRSSEKLGVVSKMPGTLIARKVTVDPLGEIRWAND